MKTVIHLRNTFLPLSETFIYDQIRYLKDFSPVVLTRKYINRDIFPLGNVFEIPNRLEALYYAFSRRSGFFEKVISEQKAALIHAHYGIEGVYALRLKEKFKIPLVTSFYGHDISRLPKFTLRRPAWFNYWRYFSVLKKEGDLFLPLCEFLRNNLINQGFPPEKLITHYIGIDVNEFISSPEDEKEPKTILTVGRLVEKKGTKYLLNAFARIQSKHPDAKLVIIGDGPLRKSLERQSNELKLSGKVFFLGAKPRTEVITWMRESHLFCLPSITARNGDTEGLPTVIMEASACSRPVISTYHAGIPEVVIDGETGFLVPEKDEKLLAEKITLLLEDNSLCVKFGARAREFICEKFDIRKQTEKLEKIYQSIL